MPASPSPGSIWVQFLDGPVDTESKHLLKLLPGKYAVCRFPPDAMIPEVASAAGFYSVTRTEDELSVVLLEGEAPADARCETGLRLLRVEGPLDFSAVGILASLVGPMAEAGVPVLSISTFDTDYLLVRERDMAVASKALRGAGHSVAECS